MGTDLIDFLVEQIYFWKKKLMEFLNSIQRQILKDAQKVDGKDKEARRR